MNNNKSPKKKEAIPNEARLRMQVIFNSQVQDNVAEPFPTIAQRRELTNQYNITYPQICNWFKDQRNYHKRKKPVQQHSAPMQSSWPFPPGFTGTILKTLPKSSKSDYVFQVSDTMFIDAEMEGNTMRFINHSHRPNAAYISVTTEGHDTAYVRAIKEIKASLTRRTIAIQISYSF